MLSGVLAGEHVSILCGDPAQNDGVCCTQRGMRRLGGKTVSQRAPGEGEMCFQAVNAQHRSWPESSGRDDGPPTATMPQCCSTRSFLNDFTTRCFPALSLSLYLSHPPLSIPPSASPSLSVSLSAKRWLRFQSASDGGEPDLCLSR